MTTAVILRLAGLYLLLGLAIPSAGQDAVLPLWEAVPESTAQPESLLPARSPDDVPRVANVSNPRIEVFLPPADIATGAAVVVAPGGGYNILAIEHEGREVVQWLNRQGVAGILLYYRVPQSQEGARYADPVADGRRAVELVRANARAWGIESDRIGMLGFSAGGHLTLSVGTQFDRSTRQDRPDFLIPIYPAYLLDGDALASEIKIDADTPPTLILHADDDRSPQTAALGSAVLYGALARAGVSAELHVFAKGGHGFGIRATGEAVDDWPQVAAEWMRSMGFLSAPELRR